MGKLTKPLSAPSAAPNNPSDLQITATSISGKNRVVAAGEVSGSAAPAGEPEQVDAMCVLCAIGNDFELGPQCEQGIKFLVDGGYIKPFSYYTMTEKGRDAYDKQKF